jgi:hypothetical protein
MAADQVTGPLPAATLSTIADGVRSGLTVPANIEPHYDPATMGTMWDVPGRGATVAEIIHEIEKCTLPQAPAVLRAVRRLAEGRRPEWRSAIVFTGRPLNAWDLKRFLGDIP